MTLHRGHPVGEPAVVEDGERQLLAALGHDPVRALLEARLLQDGDRLLRVVGVVVAVRGRLRRVHPGGERGGDDPGLVRGRLVAVLADQRGLVPVDRIRHRLPHRDVLQHRVRQVDEDAHVRDRREPVVVVRALRQVELLDVRDELAAPLRLTAGQVGVGRVVGQERRVVDRADLRQARLPVVRVGRVLDVLRGAGAAARPCRRRCRPGSCRGRSPGWRSSTRPSGPRSRSGRRCSRSTAPRRT